MSNLSMIPNLISIEVKQQNKQAVLLNVNDSFQITHKHTSELLEQIKLNKFNTAQSEGSNLDKILELVNLNKFDTTEKIFFIYKDNGGRRIGNKSSTNAILDAHEIIKSFIKQLHIDVVILYSTETAYGRFLQGTFPSIVDICNELNIKIIVIVPSLYRCDEKEYITLMEKLGKNSDFIVKMNYNCNHLFDDMGFGTLKTLEKSFLSSVAKTIYNSISDDTISITGIESSMQTHPDFQFKIDNNLFVDITKT